MIAKFIKSKIIGVLLIALSIVALALAVMMYTGSSKIVEQYQQMTGETISRRDGAKLVFLKAYVTATGEVEFLKSMGKSPLSVGLADGSVTNNDPSTGTPGGNPPLGTTPGPQVPSGSPIPGLSYEPIVNSDHSIPRQRQGQDYLNLVQGSTGTPVGGNGGKGCALYAVASAAYKMGKTYKGPGGQLEDAIMYHLNKRGKTYEIVGGRLKCRATSGVGFNEQLHQDVTEFFKISLSQDKTPTWDETKPEGHYIAYYSYPGSVHWIYIYSDGKNRFIGNHNSGDAHKAPWSNFTITSLYRLS